jgi:hypothetical protein
MSEIGSRGEDRPALPSEKASTARPPPTAVPAAVEVYISSCAALYEIECKRHNASCTVAGIVEERKGNNSPGVFWAPQVHAMRYANALLVYCRHGDVFNHTSSVNLLFLLPSREAGVSLLANAAV